MKNITQETRCGENAPHAGAAASEPVPARTRAIASSLMSEPSTQGSAECSNNASPGAAGGSIAGRYSPHEASHAMRALFAALPSASPDASGGIDFAATSPALLATVADYAEITATGLGLGLSAVGNLIPYAAPEMGDGTVSSDTIETLGWLITELGDTAAACLVLATSCRRQCAASAEHGSGITSPAAHGRHSGALRAAGR
jgi:hypothetical protein